MPVGSLYLHVPFCAARCRYCDFATSALRRDDTLVDAYARSLTGLVGEAGATGLLAGANTLYVGGGTPTMLGAEGLARLKEACDDQVSTPFHEASFEANPESLTDDVLAAARRSGFTRVSLGAQSFDDRELRALGRIHDARRARERVAAARASGLDVSIDLMCGIPFQTRESWQRSLDTAVGLGVDHVSCYPLMIEEGTPMERLCEEGELPWPEDDTEADFMQIAEATLNRAGLARYEVASYARPGRACRHNIAYWSGVEYLGLGTSAASMLGRGGYDGLLGAVPQLPRPLETSTRFRITVTSDARAITDARRLADLAFEVEQLTAREAAAEDLMLGMRMTQGVSLAQIERFRDVVPSGLLDRAVEEALGRGLASEREGRLVPTEQGWLLGNELYGLFWGLAS